MSVASKRTSNSDTVSNPACTRAQMPFIDAFESVPVTSRRGKCAITIVEPVVGTMQSESEH